MRLTKIFSTLALATMLCSSASAFWWGEGVDTNGPYKVFKYSYDVSCADLKDMVQDEGAVVIYEKANPPVYKKYVANSNWCDSHEVTTPDYVPAADGQCMLKSCEQHQGGDN